MTITVEAAPATNHAPVANPDLYVTGEGQTLIVSDAAGVLANDTDPDGDTIVFVDVSPSGAAIPGLQLIPTPGGGFTITPPTGFLGTIVLEYSIFDGELYADGIANVEVTAQQVEYATPVAVDDAYATVSGIPLTNAVSLFADDTDADSTFSVMTYLIPNHGDITSFDPLGGFFTYVPDAGFVGTDTFSYQLRDPNGGQSQFATVTIEVSEPANSAPVAQPDVYTVKQGETLIVGGAGYAGNDSDADGVALQLGAFGMVGGLMAGESLTPSATLGRFEYVAPTGFSGERVIEYSVSDGVATSAPTTITITVTAAGPSTEPGDEPDGPTSGDPSGDSDLDTLGGTSEESTGAAALAHTGTANPVGYALAALVLVAAGGVSILGDRRRSTVRG